MYVAATASSEDAFPYIYRVDISTDAPAYIWLESLDTTGSAIFGTPILGYEGGRRALYLAATTGGTANNSDNTYIYAFATTPLDQSTQMGNDGSIVDFPIFGLGFIFERGKSVELVLCITMGF